jgi:hypothetical protein
MYGTGAACQFKSPVPLSTPPIFWAWLQYAYTPVLMRHNLETNIGEKVDSVPERGMLLNNTSSNIIHEY